MENGLSSQNKYDVIVIGAGIAGSVVSRLLAQKGFSVLLVEKDEYSGKSTACGGLFDRSYFDRYVSDASIIEQEINKNVFHLPWGSVIYDCNQVTVKRRVYDRYLAQQAHLAGAKLLNKVRAIDYQVATAGKVLVALQDVWDKRQWQVQTKMILFADGPHSLAHKNNTFARQIKKRYWSFAYAYEVEGIPVPRNEAHIYFVPKLFPWGYGWIFPDKNESNVGVGTILPKIQMEKIKQKLFDFLQHFQQTAPLLKKREIKDKKGGFIPMWMLKRMSADSQLLLGDAAGMVSPLFGAGIDYAIDAAEAAAKITENALKSGNFNASFLNRYDRDIEVRFGKDLRKQMLLAKIIIFSQNFGRYWPVKILTVIAFGAKYSRWNKIKILAYPILGQAKTIDVQNDILSHK